MRHASRHNVLTAVQLLDRPVNLAVLRVISLCDSLPYKLGDIIKAIEQQRIKAAALACMYHLHRFFMRIGGLIAAFARQCVIRVGKRYDLCNYRYSISDKPVRISFSPPPLMVRAADGDGVFYQRLILIQRQPRNYLYAEPHIELMADIMLGGRLRRCRITMLVIRALSSAGVGCSRLVGKVDDINDSYARLEEYDRESENEVTEQVLLPVTVGAGDVLRIAHDQVGAVMQCYRKMFAIVRLVDPGICMQVSAGAGVHHIEHSEHCYSVWNKSHRCENCISQEAIRTSKTQSKVETDGGEVYYVLASRVEIDGIPYSLECVNPIRSAAAEAESDESLLGQLLIRNRQVYIDSMTQVFNRRYYDERIRNLTGEQAIAMIDIDNFKHINDTFGHPAGDEALRSVAQTVRFMLRSRDELIRYGGDEFFLLFHGLPEYNLQSKLNQICEAVREIRLPKYPDLHLSISIGGVYAAGRISELIRKADIALYEAKIKRDRAVVFGISDSSAASGNND